MLGVSAVEVHLVALGHLLGGFHLDVRYDFWGAFVLVKAAQFAVVAIFEGFHAQGDVGRQLHAAAEVVRVGHEDFLGLFEVTVEVPVVELWGLCNVGSVTGSSTTQTHDVYGLTGYLNWRLREKRL